MTVEDTEKLSGESRTDRLLREIREDYTYFRDYWRKNYEEAKIDLRYIAGDPWEPEDRRAREDNGRPVVCPDELSQYIKRAVNNLRQNKRAIAVKPEGGDASDADAEKRSAIIRRIEYDSKAQAAYTNAFSSAIKCGFGFFRVTTRLVDKDGNVEPCIKIINNPLSVLIDPDAKEADYSDMKRCFVLDTMRKTDFARKYPKAQKRSFTPDDASVAPGWFQGENILVAEYWRVDNYDGDRDDWKVMQYVTNGLEILEEHDWPGSSISIIPVLGEENFVPQGEQMERMFFSMIRRARGSQMMLAYIASQEAEEYGMAPRAPFVGYAGQFETDKEAWDTLNKVPRAYVQVDPTIDQASGQLLPLPTRPAFIPNAQAYEIGKESWRRSVQSSMGITPLPTAAQRNNEKSGVALQRIEAQQDIGTFDFTDNFNRSLENAGRQINELITRTMDTARQVGIRQPDDTHALMHVVPSGEVPPTDVKPEEVFDPTRGEYGVTISTGPSFQSQREEASAFVDLLVQELAQLPVPPQIKAQLLSKAIILKNLGPIGDEIAKLLNPQGEGEPIPPQAQQAIGQLQQQLQALNQACQEYEKQIQQLKFEKQAKLVDKQAEFNIRKMEIEADLAKAEITTKAQDVSERLAFVEDMMKQLMSQDHERSMQEAASQQQQAMAQQQMDAQAQQQPQPQPQAEEQGEA